MGLDIVLPGWGKVLLERGLSDSRFLSVVTRNEQNIEITAFLHDEAPGGYFLVY